MAKNNEAMSQALKDIRADLRKQNKSFISVSKRDLDYMAFCREYDEPCEYYAPVNYEHCLVSYV
jgi:hypothetical protein